MGTLYLVSTPIGNLQDITLRALDVLKKVDFIICEDTRHTKILLENHQIQNKPLCSFHAKSSLSKANSIIEKIESVTSAAYVSDAGTPGICDPGFILTKLALEKGIPLFSIPGSSAFLTLLPISGLRIDKFYFGGFLPHKKGRKTILEGLQKINVTHIFYESVHRFPRLLDELELFVGPNRNICIGRELTKKFESIFRGTVSEAQLHFNSNNTKGEFVVMIAPN